MKQVQRNVLQRSLCAAVMGALVFFALQAAAQSRTWSYTYNEMGQKETADGPRVDVSDITTYVYAASGNVSTVANALGHVQIYSSYDAAGRVLASQDANGTLTEFEYHPRGWLVKSTMSPAIGGSAQPRVTEFEYYTDGELKRLVVPGQAALNFEYNSANHLTAIANDLGERIEYELDLAGNPTKQTIQNSSGGAVHVLVHAYDELSRVMAVIGNNGQREGVRYDANDNPIEIDNARTATTSQSFDALNRLKQKIDPLAGRTTYSYDAQDRITSVTDANGNTTTYEYDAFGNLLALDSPDTGRTTFAYDEAGNRIRKEDASGVVVTYSYDALNRLVSEIYPGTPDENVTYTYDDTTNGNYGTGRLTRIDQGNLTASYHYDSFGKVTQKTQVVGAQASVTRYQYNDVGQLAVLTYPSGREVHYGYDSLGRVASIGTRVQAGDALQPVIGDVEYLPFGPAKSYRYGNGLTHTQTFDLDYRLTAIEVGGINPLLSRSYFYDLTNNITGIDNALALDKSQSFDYDLLDRLIQADGTYGALSYAYDPVGNRLSETRNGITDNYSYDLDSNQLLSVQQADGTRNFTYDAAGNRIVGDSPALQGQTYTYNAANRLAELHVDGTLAARYRYNPLGQRIEKVKGSTTEGYHYDEAGHLLAVTDDNNNVLREYVYWGDQQIALAVASSGLLYLHNDHLATAQVVTNQSQQVVWMADYEPFGKLTQTTSTIQHFSRFPGQYEDEESGLYYNYFRDYDPSIGRYIQSDPIGLDGGANTYAYVEGNPLVSIDPTGLVTWTGRIESVSASFPGAKKIGLSVLGGIAGQMVLTSPCIDGEKWYVIVRFSGAGGGFGLAASATASTIEVTDPYPVANPANLAGQFSVASAGASALLGWGSTILKSGMGMSAGSGLLVGIDASATDFHGQSNISLARKLSCECD